MRNMSFSMTTAQIRAGTKTVTRRFGWWKLKSGELVQPVLKAMGLRRGEKAQALRGPIRIVSTRAEPLNAITPDDCVREGFPDMTPAQFVAMLVKHYGCKPDSICNRVEFEYIDSESAHA